MSILPPEATGPEYEALRRLPAAEQKRLWRRAYFRLLRTRAWWAVMWGVGCCCGLGCLLGSSSAKILGADLTVQLLAGLMGSGAGAFIASVIGGRVLPEFLRPFVGEELARRELAEGNLGGPTREEERS